jgi:dTDP-4-amino-4,6-dideoxygalactose transaminase
MQAAILQVKLGHLDTWNQARRAHAHVYTEQLEGLVERVPQTQPWATHTYYVYVIEVEQREAFRQALAEAGVATGIHYPVPLHLQPACASYGYQRGAFPVTERAAERIVSLPMYPELTAEQLAYVVATAQAALSGKRVLL